MAAFFTFSGVGNAGVPCDRFIAWYRLQRCVIIRITDSVKRAVLSETIDFKLEATSPIQNY
jgi:hypothetical protein